MQADFIYINNPDSNLFYLSLTHFTFIERHHFLPFGKPVLNSFTAAQNKLKFQV